MSDRTSFNCEKAVLCLLLEVSQAQVESDKADQSCLARVPLSASSQLRKKAVQDACRSGCWQPSPQLKRMLLLAWLHLKH